MNTKNLFRRGCFSLLLSIAACGGSTSPAPPESAPAAEAPGLQAINAFYYYRDVDKAWEFYRDVLGFETVIDYGFAKIMRVAESSYLGLVDEQRGMHKSDEPKSVTLAIVTPQVEGWYDYLKSRGVPFRSELKAAEDRPHDGFVAIDPEGYLLEFERFNPHPENVHLLPRLEQLTPLVSSERPAELTVQATVFWLYYKELGPLQAFWESLLGVPLMVDQGWAKVYPVAGSGFIGLVDGARGLHQATEKKSVTLSFFTAEVEAWLARAKAQGLELRSQELGSESGKVTTFVAYDPGGYYLEWDTFLPVEDNRKLLEQLRTRRP